MVIANKKGTKEWFICKVDGGRTPSIELTELAQDSDFMKLFEKMELNGQYFIYDKLAIPNK